MHSTLSPRAWFSVLNRCKYPLIWCSLALGWTALVAGGFYALIAYDLQPGIAAEPPENEWIDHEPPRGGRNWSLVMFLHPHCACSRASVSELARLVEQSQVPLDVRIWFFSLPGESESWVQTPLWREAAQIPNAKLSIDVEGREARRCDATTSGQVLLYSPKGRLVFTGGITGARGHYGVNPASERLAELLSDPQSAGQLATQVFGCPLSDVPRSNSEAN